MKKKPKRFLMNKNQKLNCICFTILFLLKLIFVFDLKRHITAEEPRTL